MKKYAIIMIIGAALIAMTMSASADEQTTIQRIDSREVGSEDGLINEPVIESVSYDEISEDLLIAPNPEATIDHDSKEGERSIEDKSTTSETEDMAGGEITLENDEILDSTYASSTEKPKEKSSKHRFGLEAIMVIGSVVFLLIAFLAIRRK